MLENADKGEGVKKLKFFADVICGRDQSEHDSAGASALLSGRNFCRSRCKKNFKILLLPEVQKLLLEQELLFDQKHVG